MKPRRPSDTLPWWLRSRIRSGFSWSPWPVGSKSSNARSRDVLYRSIRTGACLGDLLRFNGNHDNVGFLDQCIEFAPTRLALVGLDDEDRLKQVCCGYQTDVSRPARAAGRLPMRPPRYSADATIAELAVTSACSDA
jgi:hypothetical protein